MIRLGISTCPNDTFAFHGLLSGQIQPEGFDFEIELMDVQELNERLADGRFDVAKASFHAALHLSEKYGVLQSGSALGFGVGPLLLASKANTTPDHWNQDAPPRILCPGKWTTATLLYQLFYPQCGSIDQCVFSEIMPALEQQMADFGVCIHEGRFTWQTQGLSCVEDLGIRWEAATGQPLPLGGILCRLDLPAERIQAIQDAIHASLCYGLSHRDETLQSMRKYAQEFSDEVLFSHVDLYVNRWTLDLGDTGREALRTLHQKAIAVGLIPTEATPLRFLPEANEPSEQTHDSR